MEIVNLPVGEAAPPDSDCIRVQEIAGGEFVLEGTALLRCGDAEPAESVTLIGGASYQSYDDAEAAGLAWADGHCVEQVYVSRSNGTEPLPEFQ